MYKFSSMKHACLNHYLILTEDFPNGTWLGDENNPEMRVRVPVTPRYAVFVRQN